MLVKYRKKQLYITIILFIAIFIGFSGSNKGREFNLDFSNKKLKNDLRIQLKEILLSNFGESEISEIYILILSESNLDFPETVKDYEKVKNL